jgi:polar amino acid transport system permease protein
MNVFFQQYFDLSVMRDNFGAVVDGFLTTLELSLISGVLALTWGLALALLRSTTSRLLLPLRLAVIAYIDALRGIPLLLVVLLISGSLPFLGFLPHFVRSPNLLGFEDVFWFGVLSIMVCNGAYLAEVYRAGLQAVPRGQSEASRSLGMSQRESLRHIILPQALRIVIPPLLNDFISLMKDTSLVQVIGVVEVVRAGREVQAETFNSSALTLGAILFLIFTLPLARVVDWQIRSAQLRFGVGRP